MKNKIIVFLFIVYIFIFFLVNIFIKDNEISDVERRNLALFPKINIKEIVNGAFFDDFESYTLDQFPYRQKFRNIKSWISFNIFNMADNNGVFEENNIIYKLDYKLDKKSINNFIKNINDIKNNLSENNVYLTIIPDKNYFLDNKNLKLDYEFLINAVTNGTNINYIDIIPLLEINDYYKTDTHWRQEKILDVASKILLEMNNYSKTKYLEKKYDNFGGVYYGQLGLNIPKENLIYLTNDTIDNAIVYDYERGFGKIYNEEKIYSMDPYNVFVNGASSYIEIINHKSLNDKELIIFRDSFGSALAPLLIENYKKVILIDTRYISKELVYNIVEFKNQDVLFAFSTMIINNSFTLK